MFTNAAKDMEISIKEAEMFRFSYYHTNACRCAHNDIMTNYE